MVQRKRRRNAVIQYKAANNQSDRMQPPAKQRRFRFPRSGRLSCRPLGLGCLCSVRPLQSRSRRADSDSYSLLALDPLLQYSFVLCLTSSDLPMSRPATVHTTMSHTQPPHAPQLAAHPCNNTIAMPPFASIPTTLSSASYADYCPTQLPSSAHLPSSIFLPPPAQPPNTTSTAHAAHMLSSSSAISQQYIHSISSFAPPGPAVSYPSPTPLDYPASFSLSLHSPHHPALIKLTATSFLPLRAWLPWLEWDGSWVESHPMQTVARCPVGRVSETVRILHEKGVRQTRHMLLAKF